MVPLRDRLSYQWNRIKGVAIHYSPVYTQGHNSIWAEAEMIGGQHDCQAIHICKTELNAARDAAVFLKFAEGPKWERERKRLTKECRSSFSWDETYEILRTLKQDWERSGYAIEVRQPFVKRQIDYPKLQQA